MESQLTDPFQQAVGLLAQAAEWLYDQAQTTYGYDANECTELREWFEMRVKEYKAAVVAEFGPNADI